MAFVSFRPSTPDQHIKRRPFGLPRALDVELPRLRLVRLLEGRWDRPVTLLVAGPGFGKTTVLAQAVRAHQVAPAFVLLRAAVRHAADLKDPCIDPLLDRAWQGLLDRRDHRGAAAVLGQAMITAQSRADLARLAVVAEWGDRLDGPVSPVVTMLCRTVAAMGADISGDQRPRWPSSPRRLCTRYPRRSRYRPGDFISTA